MRIQLILFTLFFSLLASAASSEDAQIRELFRKYDLVMKLKTMKHVDEIFSEKFLKENGGTSAFIAKLKELPKESPGHKLRQEVTWKKGAKDEMYFVKVQDGKEASHSSYVVIREGDKLKIDGTISDNE